MIQTKERSILMGIANVVAFIFATALCALCLIACGKDFEYEDLETPSNLRVVDEVLEWDEVKNALGYVVDIDGKEYETETNGFNIFMLTASPRNYSMRVKAYGDLKKHNDSAWSNAYEYTTSVPVGLGLRAINNGTEYEIAIADKTRVEGKIVIPSSANGKPITSIRHSAFEDCDRITSIIMPDTIRYIDNDAFRNCKNLTSIRLSESLEKLNICVFSYCSSLTDIDIPRSIKVIDNSVFRGCASLESVYIHEFVEKIGIMVFEGCDSLRSITVDERNLDYKSDGNCIIKKDNDELVVGCGVSVIPDYVKSIGEYAFSGCLSLTDLTIPGNVEIIEVGAFNRCKNLENLVIEDGVKIISGSLAYTFYNCISLTELFIPTSVEIISPLAFCGCKNLSFIVSEDNPVYRSENGCLIQKEGNVLVLAGGDHEVPDSVEEIGEFAFVTTGKDIVDFESPYSNVFLI